MPGRWVAIQDGNFDVYDRGAPAEDFLEQLAEDGGTGGITQAFADSAAVGADGTINAGGPLEPGETQFIDLVVDPTVSRYFSYASMVIPSNDAFISSPGNPLAIEIFDANGNFLGLDRNVDGNDVLDAGTEVNTELDAAFLNQTAPNTGLEEQGVIRVHEGFLGSERETASRAMARAARRAARFEGYRSGQPA